MATASKAQQLPHVFLKPDQILLEAYGLKNCRSGGVVKDTEYDLFVKDIKDRGLHSAPTLWKVPDALVPEEERSEGGTYVLLSGYRRFSAISDIRAEAYKAHKKKSPDTEPDPESLPFSTIQCLVFEGSLLDALAVNLSDNTANSQIKQADRVRRIADLHEAFVEDAASRGARWTNVATGDRLGMSQAAVAQSIQIMRMACPEVWDAFSQEKINWQAIRDLTSLAAFGIKQADGTHIPDEAKQIAALQVILGGGSAKEEKNAAKGGASVERRKKTFVTPSDLASLVAMHRRYSERQAATAGTESPFMPNQQAIDRKSGV
jgi:hypothetical protein